MPRECRKETGRRQRELLKEVKCELLLKYDEELARKEGVSLQALGPKCPSSVSRNTQGHRGLESSKTCLLEDTGSSGHGRARG